MLAARLYGVEDIRVEEISRPPEPSDGEVLLRVEAAGICGSDIHNFHTGMWISRAPSVPGHEFVATVEAVGNGVTTLKPGDRVVADSRVPCGACPACLSGQSYLCPQMGFVGEVNDGGFASFTLQRAKQVRRLADQSIPRDVAALSEPLSVALHAVNRLGLSPDNTVLVGGAGTIGALVTAILAFKGYKQVSVADPKEQRQHSVCEAFGAAPFDAEAGGTVDGYIDTTGAEAALSVGISAVRRGGRVAVVGLYRGPIQVDMNAIVEGGLTLAGCAAFDNELDEVVRLLPKMASLIEKLPIAHIAVGDIPKTYTRLLAGELDVQKVLIVPD